MSILDSDVLLALIRSTEDDGVVEFVKQFPSRPQTTALAIAEVTAAIYAATDPRLRSIRDRALQDLLRGLLHRRVLPLDADSAITLAKLATTKNATGSYYPLGVLIQAAISRQFMMPLVTGRAGDYQGLDLELHPLTLDPVPAPDPGPVPVPVLGPVSAPDRRPPGTGGTG
ncbi:MULTISPECIES: hypothetical protein [unclassified Arthrobacter]|uniref:hypothetical protein n=1 Tax=unclassified Arthrobacter TaxID=235627 RepID=UPI0004660D56|nr:MULTISPECIES: hypothetical protein [unclassified Arthrobacter]PVE19259.1 hypothetical protein DDA93_05500 [Arthrobacter sp. Bz4]